MLALLCHPCVKLHTAPFSNRLQMKHVSFLLLFYRSTGCCRKFTYERFVCLRFYPFGNASSCSTSSGIYTFYLCLNVYIYLSSKCCDCFADLSCVLSFFRCPWWTVGCMDQVPIAWSCSTSSWIQILSSQFLLVLFCTCITCLYILDERDSFLWGHSELNFLQIVKPPEAYCEFGWRHLTWLLTIFKNLNTSVD